MFSDQTSAVVSLIGIVVELGGALLLVGFFLLLRRFVLRRPYFTTWTWAWVAIASALAALTIRYDFVPGLPASGAPDTEPIGRALYFVYQAGKLLAYFSFVAGTRMYITGARRHKRLALEWLAAPAYAGLTLMLSPRGLGQMVIWQAPAAVVTLFYCAACLLLLPPSRRTLGTTATGMGFGLIGMLWVGYALSFPFAPRAAQPPLFASLVMHYNAYFDLLLNILLGYGMVLMLMEDATREVEDARAELGVAHDRMRRAALYDSLTGALNRRAFTEGVGLEMARGTFGTVVVADVDDMKSINDNHGHVTGDRVLCHVVETLRAALRPYDKLYRWGGDEFLLVVPSARSSDVQERVAEVVASILPLEVNGTHVRVIASVGAADYASAEELAAAIERADQAMYHQKNGRKRRNFPERLTPPAGVVVPPTVVER